MYKLDQLSCTFFLISSYNCVLTLNVFLIMKHILFCLTQYIRNMYSLEGVEEGSEEKLILSGDEIELNIPEEGVVLPSGWAILPLTQLKVKKYLKFNILAPKKCFNSLGRKATQFVTYKFL